MLDTIKQAYSRLAILFAGCYGTTSTFSSSRSFPALGAARGPEVSQPEPVRRNRHCQSLAVEVAAPFAASWGSGGSRATPPTDEPLGAVR